MNFIKLHETQALLDEKIKEEKELTGQKLIENKFLALFTELGELANEQRSWKFWSEDQVPRDKGIKCHACNGKGFFDFVEPFSNSHFTDDCGYCEGIGMQEKNPLLEEYVDNLHFLLTIGNELGYRIESTREMTVLPDITKQFNLLFYNIALFYDSRTKNDYKRVVLTFLGLGNSLGFTWEQVEQAYYKKNEINHERQVNGY